MPSAFEKQLAYGQEGEHIVARWLIGRGATVAPLYQFTGHGSAPFILWDDSGRAVRATLPDLQCYRQGKAWFSEVKRKRQWWYGEHIETGVDRRHWRAYLNVRRQTDIPLYLFFLHEVKEPTGLFGAEVLALEQRGPRIWTRGTPLVFFRREWLTKHADLSALEITEGDAA